MQHLTEYERQCQIGLYFELEAERIRQSKNKHTLKGIASTREVWLNGEKLNPRKSQRIVNHYPGGFNWGYGGSGPTQLAAAIALEY